MLNVILNILLGILTLFLGILAFADEIYQKHKLKFLNERKVLLFIIVSCLIIATTVFKEWNSSNEEKLSAGEFNHQLNDTIKYYSNQIEKTNQKNIKIFSDVLAKYGLHYDSSQNKIESIVRDSTTKDIPDLSISSESNTFFKTLNDSIDGQITFINVGNCPVKAKIQISLVAANKSLQLKFWGTSFISFDRFSINETRTKYYSFLSEVAKQVSVFYLVVKMNYETLDKRRSSDSNEILAWDFKEKKLGVPIISEQNRIRDFLKGQDNK